MRLYLLVGVILACSTACGPLTPATGDTKRTATTPARPPAKATLRAPSEPPRTVSQTTTGLDKLAAITLTGKIKLLSDSGSSVISNNAGGLVSNNSGSLISNNSGSLISNNSGSVMTGGNSGTLISEHGSGLVAKAKYSLLGKDEALLADARIEVLDATGALLVDEAGRPLGVESDSKGGFSLKAVLPAETVILRVRLFPGQAADSGQLFALLVHDPAADTRTIDLDTASSLGAAYVLERYVKRKSAVLAKLPQSEAEALTRDIAAARASLENVPSYLPADMVKAAENLRAGLPALDQTLKRIEAILLVGQADLGEGLAATAVSLGGPVAVALDGEGRLLIGESSGGRVRRAALTTPGAPISLFAGAGTASDNGDGGKALAAGFGAVSGLLQMPDGSLLVTDSISQRVRRIGPDGVISTVLGGGGDPAGQGTAMRLERPAGLTLLPDGDVLISEAPQARKVGGRVLRLTPAGRVTEESLAPFGDVPASFVALASARDGTLYALDRHGYRLLARKPGGIWSVVLDKLSLGLHGGLAAAPMGGVYMSESQGQRVSHVAADGTKTVLGGTGEAGRDGDGGPAAQAKFNLPTGLVVGGDGTLYVGDEGNNLVRAIAPDGERLVRTVAGTSAQLQVGDATTIPINVPGGLVLDPQGRLLIAESAAHVIKRLEQGTLTVLAGGEKGYSGDEGPATLARFSSPAGMAYQGDDLIVADGGNSCLRRIRADGTVTTLARHAAADAAAGKTRFPLLDTPMERVTSVAVAPDGTIYWLDNELHQVWRAGSDGQSELIAGSAAGLSGDAGDGGPAAEALLNLPFALLFDAAGRLYICDAGNLCVRRIDLAAPGRPITRVAGLPRGASLGLLLKNEINIEEGPATETLLAIPGSLALDGAGNIYIGEFGTARLDGLSRQMGAAFALLPKVPSRVRKLSPDGRLTVIAGPGGAVLAGAAATDTLGIPGALLVDREGRLIIGDSSNNQLRLLPKGSF